MTIKRTIKCDICGERYEELDHGTGFPGWCIIQGIAMVEPKEGEPLTSENTSTHLCPNHKNQLAAVLDNMLIDENGGTIVRV